MLDRPAARSFQAIGMETEHGTRIMRYEFRVLDKDLDLVHGGSWSWSLDDPFYQDFPEYIDLEKARVREAVWARAWSPS